MEIAVHEPRHREFDPELAVLLISTGLVAFASAWFAAGLPWPYCAFHSITGHPCPTCGATRSAIAFLHGQFASALQWNPLAFFFYCGLAIVDFHAVAAFLMRLPRLRLVSFDPRQKTILGFSFLALALANWIYLWNAKLPI